MLGVGNRSRPGDDGRDTGQRWRQSLLRPARHRFCLRQVLAQHHAVVWHVRLRWRVGVSGRIPSKSGVAGGIVGVVPGKFGIGVFSPPLDAKGNSVRGIATFRELSERFGLHIFEQGFQGPKL